MIFLSQTLRPENLYENIDKVREKGFFVELMLKADFVDTLCEPEEMLKLRSACAGKVISIHSVTHSLNIGSKDETIRKYSERRFVESLEIGKKLKIKDFIFHSTLMPYLPQNELEHWLEIASIGFEKIIKSCREDGIVPIIENTYEKDADIFLTLFQEFPEMRFCLDTGHVNCFSHITPDEWLVKTLDKISVIHLHDNDRDEDSHLDMCSGCVDFQKILNAVRGQDKIRLNLETPITAFDKNVEKLKELIA